MRLLILCSTVLLFTIVSCKKEEECTTCTQWQTVDVTGHYTNTVDATAGFHMVALPDGSTIPVPKKYTVGGTDNIIGTVDATKSTLVVHSVALNLKTGSFDSDIHITLYNTEGAQIHLEGTSQVYGDNTGLSWFHYTEGTGKFEGISGWLNATSVFNAETGVNTVTASGEATYKK